MSITIDAVESVRSTQKLFSHLNPTPVIPGMTLN